MTLLYTLTVGGVLWGVALYRTYPRTAMGKGGTAVYLGVFLFVTWLSVVNVGQRGRELDPAVPSHRKRSLIGSLVIANLVAAAVIGLLGVAFGFLEVGGRMVNAWLLGGMLGALVFPLAWLVGRLARPAEVDADAAGLRHPPIVRPGAVMAGLMPMLAPFGALLALLALPTLPEWEARLVAAGRAGILFQVMLPLFLPTAALVAWGLDRVDGSRTGRLARVVVSVSASVLLLAVAFLPQVLWAAHGTEFVPDPPSPAFPLGLVFPDLAALRPFFFPDGGQLRPLPLDSMFRGTAVMMFSVAVLSAYALRRLGRGIQALTLGRVLAFFALQAGGSIFGLPRYGPQAAVWSVGLAAGIVFVWSVVATRPPGLAPAPAQAPS